MAARVEGLLIEHDAAREQGIGEGRQEIEIGHVAIVGAEIIQLRLFRVEMEGLIRLVSPAVGAHVDLIEGSMLGIADGELGSEQLRSRAEIDDTAVGIEAAADAGTPAIAEIDRSGQPVFGGGHGRGSVGRRRRGLGVGGRGRCCRRLGLRSCRLRGRLVWRRRWGLRRRLSRCLSRCLSKDRREHHQEKR